jgi:hypothetical protein
VNDRNDGRKTHSAATFAYAQVCGQNAKLLQDFVVDGFVKNARESFEGSD